MSSWKCDTPKEGVQRVLKQSNTIMNRLIGIEVICGKLDFRMYCSVDQLQVGVGVGGANLCIEVQRLALQRLSVLLEKDNLPMPAEDSAYAIR